MQKSSTRTATAAEVARDWKQIWQEEDNGQLLKLSQMFGPVKEEVALSKWRNLEQQRGIKTRQPQYVYIILLLRVLALVDCQHQAMWKNTKSKTI